MRSRRGQTSHLILDFFIGDLHQSSTETLGKMAAVLKLAFLAIFLVSTIEGIFFQFSSHVNFAKKNQVFFQLGLFFNKSEFFFECHQVIFFFQIFKSSPFCKKTASNIFN